MSGSLLAWLVHGRLSDANWISCLVHLSQSPFTNITANLSRPFPPIRGWILQQVIKLAAVAASEVDVVVLVDSDIEFLRPFSSETFMKRGVVRFYRKPGEVDRRLPRHMLWHGAARVSPRTARLEAALR